MKQWQNGNDKKHNRTHIDQEYASPGAHTARKHVSYGLRSHLSILYICICVCCVCVCACAIKLHKVWVVRNTTYCDFYTGGPRTSTWIW